MSEEAEPTAEQMLKQKTTPRCTSTHWHQGEELRCIDVDGHTSAHYNVIWWPNEKGLPHRMEPGALQRGGIFAISIIGAGIALAICYWIFNR